MDPTTTAATPANPEQEVRELREALDEAHQRLAEAHKMAALGRLAAGIVHEINTPVGSIASNNDVLQRALDKVLQQVAPAPGSPPGTGSPLPPKALSLLETMSSLIAIDKIACERITAIVRSLKTFARVSESDLHTVDVNEILRNTLKLSNCVFKRHVTVETDFGELPDVECYPGLLNQVFLNLVVNASQAIEGDGRVLVRSRSEGEQVHVSITDTGKGIRPEDRPKIFGAGFTTKPIGEGTGLGLAITREIVVDTHGGSIDFESEVGRGTTFHVRLPVRQHRQSSPTAA